MGGYQILDFQKIPITAGTAKEIPGSYAAAGNTVKPVLVTGFVLGAVEFPAFWLNLVPGLLNMTGTVAINGTTYNFVIASNNKVTVTVT